MISIIIIIITIIFLIITYHQHYDIINALLLCHSYVLDILTKCQLAVILLVISLDYYSY